MDARSPSKRFTRGFWGGCMFNVQIQRNARDQIQIKKRPIRLEEMSAKSKQSNIRIVKGGKKDLSDAGSSKKRKEKTTNYTDDNAKRKEVVVSGSLEHDELCIVTMLISKLNV
ncbi:hypothetical protein H5410_041573 [Solanum commersonii]|uniref:Uncharacterized protein n=1 Tax=Solanum commersonii TaxID=4109 RepID=A0A9J5XRY5_SOLCO|nr:hypothetical protein H5410_041573 [Solanum commersonii]